MNKVIKGAGALTGAIGRLVAPVILHLLEAQEHAKHLGLTGRSRPKQTFINPDATLPKRTVTTKMLAVQARKAAQRKRTAAGQQPKAGEARQRRAAPHRPSALRHDSAGFAITLVGQEPRRVWLGGISAQRGF